MSDQNAARAQYDCKFIYHDAATHQYKHCIGKPLGRETTDPAQQHPHTGFNALPVGGGGLAILVVGLILRRKTRR